MSFYFKKQFNWPFPKNGYGKAALILLVSLYLQSTLLPVFRIGSTLPNITLAAIVILGLNFGGFRGSLMGFLTGLAMDSLNGEGLGPYALIFLICGGLSGLLVTKVHRHHWLATLICVLIATLIEGIFMYFGTWKLSFTMFLFRYLGASLVYNGIIAIPVRELIYRFLKPESLPVANQKT
jgi:rod shape-determining protein MreD